MAVKVTTQPCGCVERDTGICVFLDPCAAHGKQLTSEVRKLAAAHYGCCSEWGGTLGRDSKPDPEGAD